MSGIEILRRSELAERHRKSVKKRLTQKSARVLFTSLRKTVVEEDVKSRIKSLDPRTFYNISISLGERTPELCSGDESSYFFAFISCQWYNIIIKYY